MEEDITQPVNTTWYNKLKLSLVSKKRHTSDKLTPQNSPRNKILTILKIRSKSTTHIMTSKEREKNEINNMIKQTNTFKPDLPAFIKQVEDISLKKKTIEELPHLLLEKVNSDKSIKENIILNHNYFISEIQEHISDYSRNSLSEDYVPITNIHSIYDTITIIDIAENYIKNNEEQNVLDIIKYSIIFKYDYIYIINQILIVASNYGKNDLIMTIIKTYNTDINIDCGIGKVIDSTTDRTMVRTLSELIKV